MRPFFFDLALGLGIAAAIVVILEGIFRVAELLQRMVGRRVLRAKMLAELNRALDNPKASITTPRPPGVVIEKPAFHPTRGTSKSIDEHQASAFGSPGQAGVQGFIGPQPPRSSLDDRDHESRRG